MHVKPLTAAGRRAGADTVVTGAKEVGGRIAHNDGFALLTRVTDTDKWKEAAAAMVRCTAGRRTWITKLTGTSSHDTLPDGQLTWNGTKYGACFVVHGAGGFADGHFGDKLSYISPKSSRLTGGWSWGCSHDEGVALHAEPSGAFTSLCFDDWRWGLFVSTGIGVPDVAPVVQREQCWAGHCGGTFPGRTGDLAKSADGRYATAFASRGATSARRNPADASGRGWSVAPRTATHQVAIAFLKNATCSAGTCTGTFTGTHLRLVDWNGKFASADKVVSARITGDIAAFKNGTPTWAYAPVTPSYATPLTGASPTTTSLRISRPRP